MNKKIIKQLVQLSYTKQTLDAQKVEKIAKLLTKQELREYIKALKRNEKEITVYVYIASNEDSETKKAIETLFPEKKIVYTVEQSLLLGIKIVNNDVIYEMNLQNRLNAIVQTVQQNYDK